jgi:hypothetical protein
MKIIDSKQDNNQNNEQPKDSYRPLRLVGSIIVVSILAGVVNAVFFEPHKTNGEYLQEIIKSRTLEKTAMGIGEKYHAMNPNAKIDEAELVKFEENLSQCLTKKANEYALSNDPYLNQRADKNSPTILAKKFLKECNALE